MVVDSCRELFLGFFVCGRLVNGVDFLWNLFSSVSYCDDKFFYCVDVGYVLVCL